MRCNITALLGKRSLTHSSVHRGAFTVGDTVLLRDRNSTSQDGRLVTLGAANADTHTHRGVIKHKDIIGKESRQLVQTNKGVSFRIHEPTLADYVRLTPRIVTPIYPHDANLIVSLLDIHVDTPSIPAGSPPLEIFEAGTGHGALTLHLARAIHAANPPVPRPPPDSQSDDAEDPVYLGESISELQNTSLDLWKKGRRAIVHTLDISSKHSQHAQKIIEGFRKGIYQGNIDFHTGDVSAWVTEQKTLRNTEEPFLSHVFLDLPNAEGHLANIASVLHVNGILAVFNPSITQIVNCVEMIKRNRLPYLLDQVIELGANNIREWDVRIVVPRAVLKSANEIRAIKTPTASTENTTGNDDVPAPDPVKEQESRDEELVTASDKYSDKMATVCRPKAGQQFVGGGFLALWRRMERSSFTSGD